MGPAKGWKAGGKNPVTGASSARHDRNSSGGRNLSPLSKNSFGLGEGEEGRGEGKYSRKRWGRSLYYPEKPIWWKIDLQRGGWEMSKEKESRGLVGR